jgi:serralysin
MQIDAGGLIVGHGMIMAGPVGSFGNIVDNGGPGAGFEAKEGTLVVLANVSGHGQATIDQNATLELGGSFDGTVTFNGGYETTLKLDQPNPGQFTGTLAGLNIGDTIDLVGAPSIAHTQISGSTLTITFSDATQAAWQYHLSGNYQTDCFTIRQLPNGDTGLTLEPVSASITTGTGVPGSGYGNPYVDSLVEGWAKWNVNSGPITYWFGTQPDVQPAILGTGATDAHGEVANLDCSTQVDAWTTQENNDFIQAMQDYASVCGLTFAPATSAANANLTFWLAPLASSPGRVTLGESEFTDHVPDGHLWEIINDQALLQFSPNAFAYGGLGNETIVHELGHTLGMAHPHDGGFEQDASIFPGVDPNNPFTSTGTNGQNETIYTVMSYAHGWLGAPPFTLTDHDHGDQGALGAFDIAAMQTLYGLNNSHNPGDDTYTLPQANAAGSGWSCIWDTGGNNTISNAGSNLNCTIILRPAPLTGAFAGRYPSWAYAGQPNGADYAPIQGGFTIANGTVIQNAVGGEGNDVLIGGSANVAYTFTGGGGNDRIIGGAGNQNTAVYSGPETDYSWSQTSHDGSWTITDNRPGSPDGTDTLQNVQDLKFADAIFILPLTGPSITIFPINNDDVLTAAQAQSPLTISGIASVAGQVTVTLNGRNYFGNVDVSGGRSVTVPTTDLTPSVLPTGVYTVTAGIQDQIGNNAQATEKLTVENTLGAVATWAAGVSGDFATAANWTPAGVPGSGTDVQISPSGTYTVTSTANETVNSLTTPAGATLLISAGTFTISNGTHSGANAGTILVGAGASLVLNGAVANSGLIEALAGNVSINGGPVTGSGLLKVGSGGSVNATGNGYVFHGAGGSESMVGNGNLDQAFSDSGNAQLYFTGNQNQLYGGSMSDWLGVSGNSNALAGGGAGNDWMGATGNSNTLAAGSGNPTLFAVGVGNFLYAGSGQAWEGISGNQNQIFGGPAADWMGASGINNAIAGGSGNSTLFAAGSSNTLSGGSGSDFIGVSGNGNFLYGGSGNCYIAATGSGNTLNPNGAGSDSSLPRPTPTITTRSSTIRAMATSPSTISCRRSAIRSRLQDSASPTLRNSCPMSGRAPTAASCSISEAPRT